MQQDRLLAEAHQAPPRAEDVRHCTQTESEVQDGSYQLECKAKKTGGPEKVMQGWVCAAPELPQYSKQGAEESSPASKDGLQAAAPRGETCLQLVS